MHRYYKPSILANTKYKHQTFYQLNCRKSVVADMTSKYGINAQDYKSYLPLPDHNQHQW